jgi:hypothetical protein
MDSDFAAHFAAAWYSSWNAHDLDAILAHYSDDIEFTSPFVPCLAGHASGVVLGRSALRSYFASALRSYPDLNFVPRRVFCGLRSLVVEYESVSGLLASEFMEFAAPPLVSRVSAHYIPR